MTVDYPAVPTASTAPRPLHHLVYSSTAPVELPDATLAELLRGSRRRNQALGITGLLLYQDRHFLQVLEGPEAAVRTTYQRIARDQRHYALSLLSDGPIAGRVFADWSMGFAAPSPAFFVHLAGYLAPDQRPLPTPRHSADAGLLQLIEEFALGNEVFL